VQRGGANRYNASMCRKLAILIVGGFFLACLASCHSWSQSSTASNDEAQQSTTNNTKKESSEPLRPVIRGIADDVDDEEISGPGEDGELSAQGAASLAWRVIEEAAETQPVLAVWMFDASPSSQRLVAQTTEHIKQKYISRQQSASDSGEQPTDAARIESAVLLFADETKDLLAQPSSSTEELANVFDSTSVISSEVEHTFSAIHQALDRYGSFHQKGYNVLFFVITDEAGDDWTTVDQLLPRIGHDKVAVYVIGSPAPFGRVDLGAPLFSAPGQKPANTTRYGPESRDGELVRFDAPFRGDELSVMDSGFGPFALEWLCRESGGVFLAVRPKSVSDYVGVLGDTWPSPYAKRFPREVMRQYAPDYSSAEDYQKLLAGNAAANALHRAAALKPVEQLMGVQLEFSKRDEAQFSGDLGKAQQLAARIEPGLTKIFNVLKEGETARDQLPSKRWQAGYDLAIGQISISRARVEGYNSMLARAKRGMIFKNPASKSWVLEPAEEHADSSLEKLATRGREYLDRVQREHPNTPWAAIAEHELSTPSGWTWTER